MSKYTAELRTIIDNGFNIFDFEYTRSPESLAILSNEKLQQGFIDRYYFDEVGFETLERFKQRLKTQWCESIENFDKLLVAFNQELNPLINYKGTAKNRATFSDTPKSKFDHMTDFATNITETDNTQEAMQGISQIELLDIYKRRLADIQSEFYDTFQNLFMGIL